MSWEKVADAEDLTSKGRLLVKPNGKQIALFYDGARVLACNNRCPHEGYPLIEGTVEGCVLTCNWHNWKFDLQDGATLIGGDALRVYPAELRDGAVWVDISDPPPEARREKAMAGLAEAFADLEEDRMAREIARYTAAGGDPLDAIVKGIAWSHARLELGTTHAYAASADWLRLRERDAESESQRLMALVEGLIHMADDIKGEPDFPYPEGREAWDAAAFVAAIEAEDEPAAAARLRGALAEGLGYADLEGALAEAALAHYQGFGHAAIYVVKTGELIARLGAESAEPLLLALTRYLIMTRREDLIPEFRRYAPAVAAYRTGDGPPPAVEDLTRGSVKTILSRIAEARAEPEALYGVLLQAAARQMLAFDVALQDRPDLSIARTVNWLDFTHAITFANAGRRLARANPHLWPAVHLQIGCFIGRNSGFLEKTPDFEAWRLDEPLAYLAEQRRALFRHPVLEPIVAAHLVKLLTAVTEELEAQPDAAFAADLPAAVRRFLETPLRLKHGERTAEQALGFVVAEG